MAFKGLEACQSCRRCTVALVVSVQIGRLPAGPIVLAPEGQADLVLVKGTFYLLVTLDTPEAPPMVLKRFLGFRPGHCQPGY